MEKPSKKPTVSKRKIELYQVRHEFGDGWADISLTFGEKSVNVMVSSDYGSFSHYWGHCGYNPKEFLTDINFDYCMGKFFESKKLYILDAEACENEIKQSIISLRKDGELTADEAREAWDDLLNPEYGPQAGRDYYHRELYESKHFERVFVDYESLPEKTKINPLCQEFWNNCWLPFIDVLKAEINTEQVI
ncbi:hypothetical protein [Plesiomonas shigelloides]|uniref:hypothetical protein n=1 Tax=Plesiomonas shigelloides TaxID=703 RepID=UPI000A1099AA|nr:hypothetical protein [Plesiomonas shigelloides]